MLKLETDIESYLLATKDWVNRQLDQLIPENPNNLNAAARYSLLGGGKRIRPILTLATTQVLQGNVKTALNPACALEMVHTYSLIHDDLPAMDNDDFRRGKPTLHKVYPESHAILTGDFLLNYAFELLAESPGLSADQKIALIMALTKAGGAEGMIGGQIMDLEANGQELSLTTLEMIHRRKTSALIEAAFSFGAIIAQAKEEEKVILKNFGRSVGLIFQIVDDVLDISTDKKTTYATLLGVEGALKLAKEIHHIALSLLSELPYDATLLAYLADTLLNRKR
jgi:geranylgeranyl diphosphate synthase, type II